MGKNNENRKKCEIKFTKHSRAKTIFVEKLIRLEV